MLVGQNSKLSIAKSLVFPGWGQLSEHNNNSAKQFFVQDGITEYFNESLAVLSTSVVNVKDASKDFLNDLNKKTLDELSLKSITDHERYLLNHKLDTLKEMGV